MMTKEKEKEFRLRLKAYKHWQTKNGLAEWLEGPGPDIELLLSHIDELRAKLARSRENVLLLRKRLNDT